VSSEADKPYRRRPVVWIVVALVLVFVVVPTLIWVMSNTLTAD
jgi:heme/copper-type cytochrome/quinol oxidase subunit 4